MHSTVIMPGEGAACSTVPSPTGREVFWHGDLPPASAEPLGEHVLEATSGRVPATIAGEDALWERCRQELTSEAHRRLHDEIVRLHGRYAHVLGEVVETRHDPRTNEAWLRGRYTYMLYR